MGADSATGRLDSLSPDAPLCIGSPQKLGRDALRILVQAAPECVDLAVIAAALTDEGRGLDCRARFGRWPGFPVRCIEGCPLPVPHPRRVSSAGRATHL